MGVVFETIDDKGTVGSLVQNIAMVQGVNQWGFQGEEIFIALPEKFAASAI